MHRKNSKYNEAFESLYIEYCRLMDKAYQQLDEKGSVDDNLDSAILSIEIDMKMLENAI